MQAAGWVWNVDSGDFYWIRPFVCDTSLMDITRERRRKKEKKLCKGDNSPHWGNYAEPEFVEELQFPWKLKQTKLVELVKIF